jgi:hypothetical protein
MMHAIRLKPACPANLASQSCIKRRTTGAWFNSCGNLTQVRARILAEMLGASSPMDTNRVCNAARHGRPSWPSMSTGPFFYLSAEFDPWSWRRLEAGAGAHSTSPRTTVTADSEPLCPRRATVERCNELTIGGNHGVPKLIYLRGCALNHLTRPPAYCRRRTSTPRRKRKREQESRRVRTRGADR